MFVDERSEDVIHHCLECGGRICKPKEHYCWFEHAEQGFECCLPLVTLLDSDIIISPSDVKFSENECLD